MLLGVGPCKRSLRRRGRGARPHELTTGLQALAQRFTLRIVSLNYDDVPEHGALGLETGYKRLYDGFVPQSLYEPSESHFHLQLHGSVLFGPDLRGQAVLPRYSDRAEARATWVTGSGFGVGPDGLERFALPMVTGFRKADQDLWEPFGTYMGAFRFFAPPYSHVARRRVRRYGPTRERGPAERHDAPRSQPLV